MDIDRLLDDIGLPQYAELFRLNDIDGALLCRLSDADLKAMGITSLGHRKTLMMATAATTSGPVIVSDSQVVTTPGPLPERRQLTVMFADLVASTTLSTRLDPEDMSEVIRSYQNAAAVEIARFDGHLAQFLGDGVLAYFGWPRAHEDDAERAVRAGLAITRAISQLRTPAAEQLQTRIGIATGLVVVGDLIGEGAGQQHAVVGETPNLAARLQGVAQPGTVVVAKATRHLVGDLFAFRELGAQNLKGIAKPMLAYEALAERTLESRFAGTHTQGAGPIVGRDQELAVLLRQWQSARIGEGQIVLLSGEAGIGKSRIAEALIEAAGREPYFLVRYQCSPYHTDSALYPVVQQLAHAAGFTADDSPEHRLDRLEALLASATDRVSLAAPLMAALLGIDASSRYGALTLTPQELRSQTRAVLIDQFLGLARRNPLLWIVEDAHWIDPTTLDLIEHVLDHVKGAKALAIITSRPTFSAAFAGHPVVTRLTLDRLDRVAMEAIVGRISRGKLLPKKVIDEIAAKTDGMPLFVEEMTKAVIETGALREGANTYHLDGPLSALAIPATLHDSLMARLDRLAPLKSLAQLAATIGRDFSYELLCAVSNADEPALQRQLAGLVGAELIYQRGVPPHSTYKFKHALIQDAAYQALLKTTRKQYHRRIAEVVAHSFPDVAAKQPEILAHHYKHAGLTSEAIDQWKCAGEHALKRSAYQEAIGHLSQALQVAKDLPDGLARLKCELDLQVAIAPALDAAKGVSSPDVQSAYARAWEICQQLGDKEMVFPVLMGLRRYYFVHGELTKARSVAEQLMRLPSAPGDRMQVIESHLAFGVTSLWSGEMDETLAYLRRGIEFFDSSQLPRDRPLLGRSTLAMVNCLAVASWALWAKGSTEEALTRSLQSVQYARSLEHPISIASALDYAAALRGFRGEVHEMLKLADEGIVLCQSHGLPFWLGLLTVRRGWALASLGQTAEGLEDLSVGIDTWQGTGAKLAKPFLLAIHAEALTRAGKYDKARAALEEALADGTARGERFYEAEVHRLIGELQLLTGRHDEAQASFRCALEVARSQGVQSWALRAAISIVQPSMSGKMMPDAVALLTDICAGISSDKSNLHLNYALGLINRHGSDLRPDSPTA